MSSSRQTARPPAEMIFPFDHPHDRPPRELISVLGGKGAGLAEMTSVLGLPVPAGFTVAVPLCGTYRDIGWPEGLDAALEQQCRALEQRMGRSFGGPTQPLLLAVRSGAPRSMPGMMYATTVLGVPAERLRGGRRDRVGPAGVDELRAEVDGILQALTEEGLSIPDDPMAQLRGAVEAVFRSWDSPRARAYPGGCSRRPRAGPRTRTSS